MAKFYSELDKNLIKFIGEQKIYFTATAPIEGRINLSPKGVDTFRCLDEKTVAYLDLTGSGNESAAHIAENGRMTIMFCSFTEKPLILRLYGRGEVVRQNSESWEKLHLLFPTFAGQRQIIVLHIESLQTSCGFGVPVYELMEERTMLTDWAEKKGDDGIKNYWEEKNQKSIDGLPTGLFSSEQ
jgi:Pyridoxamine 5'-phosphate oxidase